MQCRKCGTNIEPGMAFCPECGTPVNPGGATPYQQPVANQSSYDPTVAAPQSGSYEPTVAAPPPYVPGQSFPPPGGQSPAPSSSFSAPTQYGGPSSYAPPPPPPASPGSYGGAPAYGAGTPPAPYSGAQQGTYGTPPPPTYSSPYGPPPGTFAPQGPQGQPPRRGPNVGLIIGIIVLLLILLGGGGFLALRALNNKGGQTSTTPTPGTTTTGNTPAPGTTPSTSTNNPSPSGSPIDPTASQIITNIKTASGIDSNLLPTNQTDQFNAGDTVYVTYNLSLSQSGFVEAKVYADNTFVTKTSLAVTKGQVDHGYFKITFNKAAAGAFELYWCTQSDCSDEALGGVATFTVS